MLDALLAGIGGVGGLCAATGLILKLWPGTLDALANGLYAHVDPSKLPYDSVLSQHFAHTREMRERQDAVDELLKEMQRDTVKNTILQLLLDRDHDHSREVAYELQKLDALHAECWIVPMAQEYIAKHSI